MKPLLSSVIALVFTLPVSAADEQPKPNTLTPKEIAEGWILLFDGETTFGWKIEGEAKVVDGALVLGGEKPTTATFTTRFRYGNLWFEADGDAAPTVSIRCNTYAGPFLHVAPPGTKGWHRFHAQITPDDLSIWAAGSKGFGLRETFHFPTVLDFHVPAGQKLPVRTVKFWPRRLAPAFNGMDLTGWKEFPGRKSKFAVNDKGELTIKDGPGDLQTEGQWDDFILQLDAKTNGKHLNSGVFFRCIPGEYQQGYEAQIQNGYKDGDRTKPVDFGTGAIYRRQPARKVVADDNEWFTMTVVAHGNHFATWVNGYQVVDWTDTRPENKNARNGSKLDKGPISLQGHDPTTDLSFRNIRIAELPKDKK